MTAEVTIPGERLGSTVENEAGEGTYVRNGYIYSKLCGVKTTSKKNENDEKTLVEVITNKTHNIVPQVNSIAMCRVVSNNTRFSKVSSYI